MAHSTVLSAKQGVLLSLVLREVIKGTREAWLLTARSSDRGAGQHQDFRFHAVYDDRAPDHQEAVSDLFYAMASHPEGIFNDWRVERAELQERDDPVYGHILRGAVVMRRGGYATNAPSARRYEVGIVRVQGNLSYQPGDWIFRIGNMLSGNPSLYWLVE